MSDKLGDVLPEEDASMLTDNAKNLSKEEVEDLISNGNTDDNGLSDEDVNSIAAVAEKRINNGQTMLGYDNMNISAKGKGNQGNQGDDNNQGNQGGGGNW